MYIVERYCSHFRTILRIVPSTVNYIIVVEDCRCMLITASWTFALTYHLLGNHFALTNLSSLKFTLLSQLLISFYIELEKNQVITGFAFTIQTSKDEESCSIYHK